MNKKEIRSSILTTMKKHSNTEKDIADDWLANQFLNLNHIKRQHLLV